MSRHKPAEHRIPDVSATPDVDASSFTSCCGRRISLFERRCGVTVCLQSRRRQPVVHLRESTTPPLLPRATVIVSALRRHDRANPLWVGRGFQFARRGANGLMKINLRQDFYAKCRSVYGWPDRTVSGRRSADALVKLFDDHSLSWASRSENRAETTEYWTVFSGNSNHENTLVVYVDDQSTVGREEGKVQQTSPMAHTSSLRLVYRELTVRVIIFTAGSVHEQFHCAERCFQQLFIGEEARVLHAASPQRIMKCDVDVHEEMCTYVVSGDTTTFQDIGEHMPTTPGSFSDADQGHLPTGAKPLDVDWTKKPTSPSVAQACAVVPHGHSSGYSFPDASGRCNKPGVRVGRVIFVRAALISFEETARISSESVPNDGCDIKEHDGSVSEGLASYQGHFPVNDRAFEYLLSAHVRREKTPPWRQEHKRRHVRSSARAD